MSGSENWLGAGMGTLSSSESALAFSRTGVGIAGRGRGIVPSGSGVGLGVGESIGAGVGDDKSGFRCEERGRFRGRRRFYGICRYRKLTVWLGECRRDSRCATSRGQINFESVHREHEFCLPRQ